MPYPPFRSNISKYGPNYHFDIVMSSSRPSRILFTCPYVSITSKVVLIQYDTRDSKDKFCNEIMYVSLMMADSSQTRIWGRLMVSSCKLADEDLRKVDGQFLQARRRGFEEGFWSVPASSQTRIWGRLMVSSCMLVGGCRVRFLMSRPYCTLDRRRFELRTIEMLHALSASCVIPSRLQASLPRTYGTLFSLMSASCLKLKPLAAMTDGWFSPVQAVSLAGLCNAILERHDHAFLLGARRRRLLWACERLPSFRRRQPSVASLGARWTLCWAGWLSWGLLSLTRSLAIWCLGWSASSVGKTALEAWSAFGRETKTAP